MLPKMKLCSMARAEGVFSVGGVPDRVPQVAHESLLLRREPLREAE